MGQLKLYLGPSGPYYYFEKYIFSKFKDNADKYIYLLPVNRAVRYFKKQLIIGSTNKTMIDPPVFTFNTLIRHLYQYQTNKKKIASNTIRLIILKESLKNCNDELTYFKNQRLNDKGLIKKIDQMLLEFCQFGYYPSDFTAPPPSSSEVYFDFRKILNRLYQTYQNQLVDETSLFLEVVRDLNEQWFRKSFADTNTIFINGYGIYTPPMIEFIKKIKQWCDLEIKIDYDPCNRQLFQHTFTAFDSLQKVADHMINTGDPHDHIARHLFAAEFSSNNKITPKNKIKICKARNRREEISFIAATIKDYHRKYNIPLHKIAVTFPNVEKYFSLLTTVFKQYEIPYNISTGFSLAQSPLIKAYLQVIKAVLSNFRLEDIYQLITSPFLTWEYQIDPIIFSQLSSRLGLRHFGNDWYKGIEEVIKCKSEYDKYQNSITATSFEEKVKTTIKGLQWLFRILLKLKKKFSARDFHTAYLQVLKKLGMLDWYARENDQLNNQEKEKEFRAFNKFNKITDQLCWILTFLYPDRKFTLNEFYQYLILIIENSNFNLREWANYGIQIMPRLEIQSIQSNILFIGGLVDGEFPRKTIQNIFFNDEECKSMGIYSSEDIQAQDRFLFYQLISAHADEIILTYPAG
jgi:ATP-dependent helicase/nuclease subunit B